MTVVNVTVFVAHPPLPLVLAQLSSLDDELDCHDQEPSSDFDVDVELADDGDDADPEDDVPLLADDDRLADELPEDDEDGDDEEEDDE